MNPTQSLSSLGQSLWLDEVSREKLDDGTLARYVAELSVTGFTSNPTILGRAFDRSPSYDASVRRGVAAGRTGEALLFDIAIEDVVRAADLLRAVHERTHGVDGFVSLEVSPLLAHDPRATLASVRQLHAQADRPNLFIKIPGTPEGLRAIEEAMFAGIPVNVTLLFSREQYVAAADAALRGVERRIVAGLDPCVPSVASVFVSRWDVAVARQVRDDAAGSLGCAMAGRIHEKYCELLGSARWKRACNAGARPQRLLWASTGTKDPAAPDTLYVDRLAAPLTVNTMPERTLLAFADHGRPERFMDEDGVAAEVALARFVRAGIDLDALAFRLQDEGVKAFARSWNELHAAVDARAARAAS